MTLHLLIGDVNETPHLVELQCSAGKPWVPAFMWKPLDTHRPLLWTKYTHSQWGSDGSAPSNRMMHPDTLQKLLKNTLWNTTKSPEVLTRASKIPPIQIQSSICRTC